MVDIERRDARDATLSLEAGSQKLLTIQFPVPEEASLHDIGLVVSELGDALHSIAHEVTESTGSDFEFDGEPIGSAFLLSPENVLLPYLVIRSEAGETPMAWALLSAVFEGANAKYVADMAEDLANGEA